RHRCARRFACRLRARAWSQRRAGKRARGQPGGRGDSAPDAGGRSDRRTRMTYSIVARDARTGELGVAVQSHWFSVGSVVTWAEPGIGAVATQSMVDVSYGPLGLQLMRGGRSAAGALG